MEKIIHGIEFGIFLAFLIGPVFFTLIQTSVEKGFINGTMVAIGVSLSDIIYVIICYLGLVRFINNPDNKIWMTWIGGLILIIFGLYHLVIKSRRGKATEYSIEGDKKGYRYILKGFIINGLSPSVLFFWVGTISLVSLDFGYSSQNDFILFFTTVLATVLSTDILKAFLANKLRRLITPRMISLTNVVLGLILFVVGVKLILLGI